MSSIDELKTIIGSGGINWAGSTSGSIEKATKSLTIPIDTNTKVVDITARIYSYTSGSSSAFTGVKGSIESVVLCKTNSNYRISSWNGNTIFKIFGLVSNGKLSGATEVDTSNSNIGTSEISAFGIVMGAISVPISNDSVTISFTVPSSSGASPTATIMAYTM